jgi:transcriptional regulator with XRE-family HTH domain
MLDPMKVLTDYLAMTGTRPSDLAKRIGVTPSYISHLLAGKRTPSVDIIRKLASATGITIENLVNSK